MRTKVYAFCLALVLATVLEARATTVTATLDPTDISLGDSAQLTVTVSGSDNPEPIPAVDGLEVTNVEHSTFMNIINGSMSSSTSNIYSVTPEREGTFVIPAIHAGKSASQPITFHVSKGTLPSSSSPAPASRPPMPGSGPVVMPQPQTTPASQEPAPGDRYGFIDFTIPKKEFFEGEVVPVDIKVYVPNDIQANVSDLPQFTGDGFTLNSLSTKLNQTEEVVNNREYSVLSWHSELTAIKTGSYSVSLRMPMSVVAIQRMAQPNGNDIFDNFFGSMRAFGTRKSVTLNSKPNSLTVLQLPTTDRPTAFSGAVGQFDVETSATPTSVAAGDPLTLRMKITGKGNFDRVSSEMLAANPPWKTYAPKSSFQATDAAGYEGTKTFEQPVIPSDSSATSIPSLTFSFFDPEKRQYITRATAPIAVSVTGGAAAPVASPIASSTTAPAPVAPKTPPPPAPDLRPNQIESGTFASTLRPIYLNPLFVAGQGMPLLALVSLLLLVRQRRQAALPECAMATATERAIRDQITEMDVAMKNRLSGPFFIHARSALQQRFGQRWNVRPETITVSDVETRLGDSSANVRMIFDMADQARYSDLVFGEADLKQWRDVVMHELEEKKS